MPAAAFPSATGRVSAARDAEELANVVTNFRRALSKQLRAQLPDDAARQPKEALQKQLLEELEELLLQHGALLDIADQETIVQMVLDDVYEFGPLSELMRDTGVSDILVNGPYQIFLEKAGQLLSSKVTFDDEAHLSRIMQRMVAASGRRLDADNPIADIRLVDGSRMNAILNPPAINGPLVSIRRFGSRPLTAEDLLANGTLTPEMLDFLAACVRSRLNIVIAGGTGSGKTTLLNVLSRFIRLNERIATHRRHRRARGAAAACSKNGIPAPRFRRVRRDHDAGPRQEHPPHPAGPDHYRRVPRRGNVGNAAGNEYGSRREHDHDSFQFAAGSHLPDGIDDCPGRG
jgi:pilus assembly protein CpaF